MSHCPMAFLTYIFSLAGMKFYTLFRIPKLMLALVCAITIYSCNTNPDKISEQQVADSIPKTSVVESASFSNKPDSVNLKNMLLNEKEVIAKRLLSESQLLENDAKAQKDLSLIDSIPDKKRFKYHLFDTLFLNKTMKVVLMGREYSEENIIWMLVLDEKGNLTSSKELYYDNAEGFRSVNSEIKNNIITVTTSNDFAETTAEQKMKQVFMVSSEGKIVPKN